MKIKTVEIFGFKSFFDKSTLKFQPGITAMVGPNGCGKSNIVDAIRWSLGEQSAKHLRGNSMEDVIFNGSRSKKPLGMAEVTLTFANDNGHAPVQYRNFSEIQVTRRVFRSGESEYYINKAPCRLKDITELFLDTGVGSRAYSIIEQGRVESILSAKPADIRLLLEEAAGISKYKARKQEALRKMDATRQNLARVNDLVGEIQKQINALKYQAQKLKRFKSLKDRIRTLELALSAQQYRQLSKARSEKEKELNQIKDRQSQLMTEIEKITAESFTRKTDLQEEEEKFSAIQRKKYDSEYAIRKEENTVQWAQEKSADAERLIEKADREIEENQGNMRQNEEALDQATRLKVQLQDQITAQETRLKEKEQVVQALKREYAALRTDVEKQREELFDLRNEISRQDHIIERSERTRTEYEHRLQQNLLETEDAETTLEELRRERAIIQEDLDRNRHEKQTLEEKERTCQQQISWLEGEVKRITGLVAGLKEKQARCESLLESLQELRKNFEGCSEGVRSVMQRAHASECGQQGMYGLVADLIETDSRYETAVEAALGEKLQYIVVKSQVEGVEAISYLKAGALGRVSFVPVTDRKPVAVMNGEIEHAQAVPLLKVVTCKEEYEPLMRYLLGTTLVVENLSQALELWRTNNVDHRTLVTLEGELIDPWGIITGGVQNGTGSGLLRKKREIIELEEKLQDLACTLGSAQEELEQKQHEFSNIRQVLKEVQGCLVQQKLLLQNRERDWQQNSEEIRRTEKKIEFLHLDDQKLRSELQDIEADLEQNILGREELSVRHSTRQEMFSQLQRKEASDRETIEQQEQDFSQAAIDMMDLKSRLASISSSLNFREQAIEEGRRAIKKNEHLREEAEEELVELRKKIDAARHHLDKLVAAYQQHQGELQEQENRLNERRNDLYQDEERLKGVQRAFNDLQPLIQELDHEHTRLSSQVRYLEETIGSKYHVLLHEIINDDAADHHPDEQIRSKLEKLIHAQESMMEGINFNAERDYEEQVQKHEFYQAQSDDLNRSLHSLQEAISKINRTSRERFRETFEKVNENFHKIVPLIFEGGRGELSLTDEHDLLETGVEIKVQPAGKSLKTITLLSGGEKALSAISLLFSLYLYKPSPFCLFDEVDSPLDDANVYRFANILKQFANDSQFLVITHNKHTMEAADILYGITMEEPGVSKVVSVQLKEPAPL